MAQRRRPANPSTRPPSTPPAAHPRRGQAHPAALRRRRRRAQRRRRPRRRASAPPASPSGTAASAPAGSKPCATTTRCSPRSRAKPHQPHLRRVAEHPATPERVPPAPASTSAQPAPPRRRRRQPPRHRAPGLKLIEFDSLGGSGSPRLRQGPLHRPVHRRQDRQARFDAVQAFPPRPPPHEHLPPHPHCSRSPPSAPRWPATPSSASSAGPRATSSATPPSPAPLDGTPPAALRGALRRPARRPPAIAHAAHSPLVGRQRPRPQGPQAPPLAAPRALAEPAGPAGRFARDDAGAAQAPGGQPAHVLHRARPAPQHPQPPDRQHRHWRLCPPTQAPAVVRPRCMQFHLYVVLDEARLPLAGPCRQLTHIGHTPASGRDASTGLGSCPVGGSPVAEPFGPAGLATPGFQLGPCAPRARASPRRSFYQALTCLAATATWLCTAPAPFKRPLPGPGRRVFVPLQPHGTARLHRPGSRRPAPRLAAMPENCPPGLRPALGLHPGEPLMPFLTTARPRPHPSRPSTSAAVKTSSPPTTSSTTACSTPSTPAAPRCPSPSPGASASRRKADLLGIQRFFTSTAPTSRPTPGCSSRWPRPRRRLCSQGRPVANRGKAVPATRSHQQAPVERATHSHGRPYIPASSLKGALRTAPLLDGLNAGRRPLSHRKGRGPNSWDSTKLEKRLLEGDFATSPLRLLKPADLMPVRRARPRGALRPQPLQDLKRDKDGRSAPSRPPHPQECIAPGQYRAFAGRPRPPAPRRPRPPRLTPARPCARPTCATSPATATAPPAGRLDG